MSGWGGKKMRDYNIYVCGNTLLFHYVKLVSILSPRMW